MEGSIWNFALQISSVGALHSQNEVPNDGQSLNSPILHCLKNRQIRADPRVQVYCMDGHPWSLHGWNGNEVASRLPQLRN